MKKNVFKSKRLLILNSLGRQYNLGIKEGYFLCGAFHLSLILILLLLVGGVGLSSLTNPPGLVDGTT